jgi:hypothetical protein
MQIGRPDAPRFKRTGFEVLDEDVRGLGEIEQQRAAAFLAQVKRNAPLVAAIDLPVDADAFCLPVAQVIAVAGPLNLDDIGAMVGEQVRYGVAGDKAREIENAQAVER